MLNRDKFELLLQTSAGASGNPIAFLRKLFAGYDNVPSTDAEKDFAYGDMLEKGAEKAEESHDYETAKTWRRKGLEKKMEGAKKLAAQYVGKLKDMGAKEVSFSFGVSFILQGSTEITFDLERVAANLHVDKDLARVGTA